MAKVVRVSAGKIALVSLVILLALAFAGCAKLTRVTQVDNKILFDNQNKKEGIFTSGGLTVDYSYQLSGGNIDLKGQVSFSNRADSLNVYLLFVDSVGTVLVQKKIYSSGYRDSSRRMSDRTFQQRFIVPTKAKGVSFTYTSQPYRGQR